MAALIKNASVLVFPSFYEGFGLPPLEAMSYGCPLVVSRVASLPEVCGDAAIYVDPYDAQSIAGGIQKVLADNVLRRSLVRKGFERAKLFSWKESAQQHLRIFLEEMQHLTPVQEVVHSYGTWLSVPGISRDGNRMSRTHTAHPSSRSRRIGQVGV
jgi:hypothetical protein